MFGLCIKTLLQQEDSSYQDDHESHVIELSDHEGHPTELNTHSSNSVVERPVYAIDVNATNDGIKKTGVQ